MLEIRSATPDDAEALLEHLRRVLEGRRRGAVYYEGEYRDDLVMGRWLG